MHILLSCGSEQTADPLSSTLCCALETMEIHMNKNQLEGAVKNTAGKVQEKIGDVIGSPHQQAKGVARQIEGTAQKNSGDVEQVLKDSARIFAKKR